MGWSGFFLWFQGKWQHLPVSFFSWFWLPPPSQSEVHPKLSCQFWRSLPQTLQWHQLLSTTDTRGHFCSITQWLPKAQTITHYVTSQWMYFSSSLAVFCPYGSMSTLWVNYQVCQAPSPAPRPPRKKNITLQGQDAGLPPPVLPDQFSMLPEMSQSAGDLLNHSFS